MSFKYSVPFYMVAGVTLLTTGIAIGTLLIRAMQEASFYKSVNVPIFSVVTGCVIFCGLLSLIAYQAAEKKDLESLSKFGIVSTFIFLPLAFTGIGISGVELYMLNYHAPRAIIQSELTQAAYTSLIIVVVGIAIMSALAHFGRD